MSDVQRLQCGHDCWTGGCLICFHAMADAYDALARQLAAVKTEEARLHGVIKWQGERDQLRIDCWVKVADEERVRAEQLERQLASMTALHLDTCGDLRAAEADLAEAQQLLKEQDAELEQTLEERDKARGVVAEARQRLAALEALVGTVREIAGCQVRNVKDIDVEQHSREIGAKWREAEARLTEVVAALDSLLADIRLLCQPECSNPEIWEARIRAVGVSAEQAAAALARGRA